MAIRKSSEALKAAKQTTRNTPGMCQKVTREWFNAPAVGDVDKDGDADAVDGWKSEPVSARHPGDRNPPAGKPLSFSGGSKGHGHRCISEVKGLRSTDMYAGKYKKGYTSSVMASSTSAAIGIVERAMGVKYLGWSDTIDGKPIPPEVTPPVAKPPAKPTPPVSKPDPKIVLNVRVASANLQSNPKNKNVKSVIDSVNTIGIVGFQEADPESFKIALKKKWPAIIQLGDLKDNTYAAPVVGRGDAFRHVKTGTRIIHKGVAGVSYTRRLTWAILERKDANKVQIGVINLHAVLVKKDDKYKKRLEMRESDKAALKAQVDAFQKLGLPVVVTGDFNDTANWLGATYGGQRVQRIIHKVDQVLVVNSAKHAWTITASNHADNSSDHDVLRVRVQLKTR
jgi:endonuclease/exonuclease/phosphatase family metal-dependent hydrolase